jgi:hypothetical protein
VQWLKQGRVFQVCGQHPWMASHAQVPRPLLIDDERLRVYFGTRDAEGRTRTALLDVEPADPGRAIELHDRPVLDLGARGTFDDSGAMPSCLVARPDALYLFYIGWQRTVTVPYRNAIGLAVSTDGGERFDRVFDGPIMDRNAREPFFVTSPFVLCDGATWRMWYSSATAWVGDPPSPVYVIKYAESANGVDWTRPNETCIAPRSADEATGSPWVLRDGNAYRMWFSYRGAQAFRTDRQESYRIGYAESPDGVSWTRKDDDAGIAPSDAGWDSEMVAYPGLYEHQGTMHLLYNGNGFGASGFGHAVAARDS